MQSTFHGLETARRGLSTQQYALRTVGHNIANANTPGYTRQRVNFAQTEPYPAIGMNRPRIPGHLGTGVKADSVQRVREQFLDIQYRKEMNKVGYWNGRLDSYMRMEDVLIETEDRGLNYQLNLFWKSLQDLAVDPEDSGARAVVRERGKFIAETFNYYHQSLTEIKNDYKSEITDAQKQINLILKDIEDINDQIRRTEPHGYVPNDLYDRQDMLLDQLSQYVNIQVTREQSGGNPNPIAEGAVTVKIVDDVGKPIVDGNNNEVVLIDGKGDTPQFEIDVEFSADGYVSGLSFKNGDAALDFNFDLNDIVRGEMKSLIEAYGYDSGNGNVKGTYPEMLAELNLIAKEFAETFNAIHGVGYGLPDANGNIAKGENFFDIGDGTNIDYAAIIQVDENILSSLNNIAVAGVNLDAFADPATRQQYEDLIKDRPLDFAAINAILNDDTNFKPGADRAYSGDSANGLLLADMKDMLIEIGGDTASISSYFQGVIGEMAVATQESFGKLASADAIRSTVEQNRLSVSSVSLDEEFTMMIQFQHAYNAAARNITQIDEMLDRIINNMGVVGR